MDEKREMADGRITYQFFE